jgi:poly(A) polymerase
MVDRLDPTLHDWMNAPETRIVMAALNAPGGEARFVGGAVRNALLGESVQDVDIATTLTPDEASAALTQNAITVVPTGIAHGTLTAVVNGRPFEVTSLRHDVSTDGRRATVAFTTDWAEDAARRDFTMNAIYADVNGTIYDPTGGIADLKAGRVRFVGDADTRIQEDYLRILRLFRFYAWYGREKIDDAALAAVHANRAGLNRLSGERLQKELLRLLKAPNPLPALRMMEKAGVLAELLPVTANLERLSQLCQVAEKYALPRNPVLSLAALLNSADEARALASRLKLSNAERERLVDAASAEPGFAPDLTATQIRKLLYRFGKDRFGDLLLLRWADRASDPAWKVLYEQAGAWTRPEFPVDGADVMDCGVAEGPCVGRMLSLLERWWVDEDFQPGRDALLAKLAEMARR